MNNTAPEGVRRSGGGRRASLRGWLVSFGFALATLVGAPVEDVRAQSIPAPRTLAELAEFESLAQKHAQREAKPRSIDELRWVFELYSGALRANTPEWEWNPLIDQVPEDAARAIKLRAQIFEACEDVTTLGCGGEFVFGYVDRSGMFHIKQLPDARDAATDPKFILSYPTGRATFKIIDLKPFGTRMPSFNEMDTVPALRRAGFQCRIQSVDRKDAVDPKFAATVRRLRAEYQRARKAVANYDAQCTTAASGFFPVFSPLGEDLQLLGGHISPRNSKLQFENPVLLVTPNTLFLSTRLDKSRTRGGDSVE
ncbi:MAG: hypothetical protein H7125_12730 [Proteobacteria bacterium]|nr:hypothetical protein [Burkholderiales bacterium]